MVRSRLVPLALILVVVLGAITLVITPRQSSAYDDCIALYVRAGFPSSWRTFSEAYCLPLVP